jgi:hypothetical protein
MDDFFILQISTNVTKKSTDYKSQCENKMTEEEFEKYKKEVVNNCEDWMLPRNLSDYWLYVLNVEADHWKQANENDSENTNDSNQPFGVTMNTLTILGEKTLSSGEDTVSLSEEEIHEYLSLYMTELILEGLDRNGMIEIGNPATMDDILSPDRQVEIKPLLDPSELPFNL